MSGKRKMSRRYGNAQTIGSLVHQNTYFMTKQVGEGFLAVLADGTIDSVTGAYGAILACETVARGFVSLEDVEGLLAAQFARAASLLHERIYRGRPPRVSLLAACFIGHDMYYRSVGGMSLASFNGRGLSLAKEESGRLDRRGVTTLLCSEGVWQALTEVDVEKMLSGRAHPYRKAQNMIEAVNRRNLKDQKSALAVIVA